MSARLAVVGLGDAGFSMHLPAASKIPSVTVVGACDTDEQRLRRATEKFSVRGFSDFHEMLDALTPDCVVIATPAETHATLAIEALSHGCNVVCEKPFTSSVGEADLVIAAAEAAGRRVAVNHEFREMPIFRRVVDAVKSDRDDISFVQAWQQVELDSSGGRVLHDAGVHLIDFVMAVFGASPIAVTSVFSSGGSNDNAHDAIVTLALQFPEGRVGSVIINRISKGENHYLDARVDTRSASYRASFGGRARLTAGLHRARQPHIRVDYGVSGLAWKEVGSRREIIARNPADPRMQASRDVIERSLRAFESGADVPCSPEWAREVTRVIEAAYRSGQSGRTEKL